MAIDKSGKWWKGIEFKDVEDYIYLLMADSYPVGEVGQSICKCGNKVFTLKVDQDEGCAQRVCTVCHQAAFIGDSEEIWKQARPKVVRCPCKNTTYEIGVGFSFRASHDDIQWITVGHRCTQCGVLGSSVDWHINYSPSLHLLELR